MNKEVEGYLKKRRKSFGHAFAGVAIFFKETAHAKIHAVATLLVVVCGFVFDVSSTEWLILLLCIGLVLGLEAMNTALEYVVDLVSPNYHPLAKKAKDVAAAAVLMAAMASAVVAAIIFLPGIIQLFGFE